MLYLNLKRISKAHLVVMLDFLGTPVRSQPKGRAAKDELLTKLNIDRPADVEKAYNAVVLRKTPDGATDFVNQTDAMKAQFYKTMGELLDDKALDKMNDAVDRHIMSVVHKFEQDIGAAAKRAVMEASKVARPVVIHMDKKTKKMTGVLPAEFEVIVQLASQRVPVMLVGPAGCGKTYLAGRVAEALDLKFYAQSCSEGVSESIFTGWLLPLGGGGTFEYAASPFVTAYEHGGCFLLDEMDAADPNLLTFLNMAIANDGFFIPQRHKKPYVKKHPDFVVIAAANTFGKGADAQYVGRNALDAATLDRYRAGMVHMDYSAEVEQALVDPEVLAWGLRVRKFVAENRMRRIMSTRVLLDLTRMKQNCEWKQPQWERAYFADWSRDEMDRWTKAQSSLAGLLATATSVAGGM